jgi:hypothetical protein
MGKKIENPCHLEYDAVVSAGFGGAFYTQRRCSHTRVGYMQCTTDAYSSFLLIIAPMEAYFFPNPLGQMTYFSSLFLTAAFFRIRENFSFKILALLPTHNKNQCAL